MVLENICVITCDLKKSRRMKNRGEVQRILKNMLDSVNNKYKGTLLAGFMITLGDEFQGVLRTPEKAYDVFLDLNKLGFGFYCGIGIGSLETDVYERVTEMAGPAFYRSREALVDAKKGYGIYFRSDGEVNDVVNTILGLISVIKNKRTKRQAEIIEHYQDNLTYEDLARVFGVTRQSISQVLAAAGFEEVRDAENVLRKILRDFVKYRPLTEASKAYVLDKHV